MGTDYKNTSHAAWTRCKERCKWCNFFLCGNYLLIVALCSCTDCSCNVADCHPLMTGRTPNGTRPCRRGIRSPIRAARPSPKAAGSGTIPRTFHTRCEAMTGWVKSKLNFHFKGLPPPPHAPRPLSSRGVLVPCPINLHPGVNRILLLIMPLCKTRRNNSKGMC